MKKNMFKYSIYFIILFTLVCICINTTTRNIVSSLSKIHELKLEIKKDTKTNLEYKKRIENMQTKPSLMEKYAKKDLNVLAEGEVEYQFNDYKKEDEVKQ
ncbi:MAG: septum formation initiator family protein [Elusimicrobia bacterium]|nr:septum formation initiator family protein [Elusimicrobiota bacterium]